MDAYNLNSIQDRWTFIIITLTYLIPVQSQLYNRQTQTGYASLTCRHCDVTMIYALLLQALPHKYPVTTR